MNGTKIELKWKRHAAHPTDFNVITVLLKQSLAAESASDVQAWGQFILRVSVGLMIFYIHGWHKLKGGIVHVRNGTPWNLAGEVAAMRLPAPVVLAFAATLVQLICALFLVAGLLTRLNAVLLTGTLSIAILQNVLARRDPQLPILYVLILVTVIFLGAGRFSLDATILSAADWPSS